MTGDNLDRLGDQGCQAQTGWKVGLEAADLISKLDQILWIGAMNLVVEYAVHQKAAIVQKELDLIQVDRIDIVLPLISLQKGLKKELREIRAAVTEATVEIASGVFAVNADGDIGEKPVVVRYVKVNQDKAFLVSQDIAGMRVVVNETKACPAGAQLFHPLSLQSPRLAHSVIPHHAVKVAPFAVKTDQGLPLAILTGRLQVARVFLSEPVDAADQHAPLAVKEFQIDGIEPLDMLAQGFVPREHYVAVVAIAKLYQIVICGVKWVDGIDTV